MKCLYLLLININALGSELQPQLMLETVKVYLYQFL